nr:hypothetical protein [Phytohabitans aurantiacus]
MIWFRRRRASSRMLAPQNSRAAPAPAVSATSLPVFGISGPGVLLGLAEAVTDVVAEGVTDAVADGLVVGLVVMLTLGLGLDVVLTLGLGLDVVLTLGLGLGVFEWLGLGLVVELTLADGDP